MSADNRICIMQDQWGRWAVWHGSASMVYHEPPTGEDVRFSKQDALLEAQEMERRIGYVEYGIQEISREEQMEALTYQIEDLAQRLRRLNASGSQWPKSED